MDRDFSRSRAILISNAVFSDEGMPDLPGAVGCAPAMRALLNGDLCGWPADRVETLENVAAPPELARKLVELTKGTQDVLLLYYVGHGLRTPYGQLALALGETSSDRELVRHTAIAYKDVAEILRGCPATTKLVILDCCHAELGNRASDQFQSADIDAEPVDGLYCIWASKEWENARSPLSGGLTYFTDAFIEVIHTGIPGKPPQLTIDQIFVELRARLLRANRPEPAQSGIRDAHHWPFARNAAPPETYRDLEKENASLLAWKAAAEDRVQILEAEVAERTLEVQRMREQVQASESRSAERQRQIRAELREANARLGDATTAQAAAQADYSKAVASVNLADANGEAHADVQSATSSTAATGARQSDTGAPVDASVTAETSDRNRHPDDVTGIAQPGGAETGQITASATGGQASAVAAPNVNAPPWQSKIGEARARSAPNKPRGADSTKADKSGGLSEDPGTPGVEADDLASEADVGTLRQRKQSVHGEVQPARRRVRRVVHVRRRWVGFIGAMSVLVIAVVVVVLAVINDAGGASAKAPPRSTLRISPHLVRTLNGRVAGVDAAYSPNGETLVTANSYGGVNIWNLATGHKATAPLLEPYYDGKTQWWVSVAYSPNGKTWAVYDGNSVSVWNVATKHITVSLGVPNCVGLIDIAYGPGGTTLVTACGSSAAKIYLWNVATGHLISAFDAPPDQNVYALAYSPNGKTFVTGDNNGNTGMSGNLSGKTYLWDVAARHIVATLTDPHSHGTNDVAYSPNGKTVATADSNGDIYLWDVATGREIATLTTRCPGMGDVVYSPDGTTLATTCSGVDNKVSLWDVATRHVVATITVPDSEGGDSIAYSPNGTSLAISDENGNTYVWAGVSR